MPRSDTNAIDLISCGLLSPNNKSNPGNSCSVGNTKSKEKLENNNNSLATNNNPNSASTASTLVQLQTTIQVESPASSTNSRKSFQFCRICHDGDGNYSNGSPNSMSSDGLRESLIAPCKCTGTVALIHLSCLEHWLTASNTDRCEICQYIYRTTRVPRTCNEYLRDPSNQFNVRNLIADMVCFMLLTPLLIISTYLCVLGANQYFVKERWEAAGLIILSLFLLGVYFTWCHVTIKYHSSVWRSWQRTNQQVRVSLEGEQHNLVNNM